MTQITSSMIQELRQRTQAGMLMCKKALEESQGNMDAAMEAIARAGHLKASKSASRVASEGRIFLAQNEHHAVLVELNSETDFVARDEQFVALGNLVANTALKHHVADDEALQQAVTESGATVAEACQALIARLGEKLEARRVRYMGITQGRIASYIHMNHKIGVLVHYEGPETLGKDLALQVAAMRPEFLNPESIPAERTEQERRLMMAQDQDSKKPEAVLAKISEGRLRKWHEEVCLMQQIFFKESNQSIAALIKSQGGTLHAFMRLEVGEGVEKKDAVSFAEEVQAQVRGG